MNILLSGICGFMGREVVKLCEANYRGASLAFGVDPCGSGDIYKSFDQIPAAEYIDCIIDFSHHSATPALLDFAVANEHVAISILPDLASYPWSLFDDEIYKKAEDALGAEEV